MPWNDNANPGPWGEPSGDGDGKDPPPRRPQGGGGGPRRPDGPDFNAGLDRLRRRLRGMGGPGDLRPGVLAAIIGGAFVLWAGSGFYILQPNEEGVVTTFGAYTRWTKPGVHYHLPVPLERVEKVAVTTLNKVDVGGGGGKGETTPESLMLTGDQDIVDLNFSVFWRVADAPRFLFATRDPATAVQAVAESAMREVVGKTPMNAISTTGRQQVQQQAAALMQKTLDSWGAGITVVEVQIRSADPPAPVAAAFRDVTRAAQDAEAAENEANTYYNRVVNEAKGDAATIIQGSEGYRSRAELEAKGEAARFNQILAEYRRAPGVTRDRMYIETMQRVLQSSNKVIVDGKGASAPIILPPDAFRPRAAPIVAAPPKGEGETAAQPTGKAAQ